MKLTIARSYLFFGLLLLVAACKDNTKHAATEHKAVDENPDTLKLALDWTPNVLHAPLFWAEKHGYFAEAGLYVEWFSTEVDNYQKKPIQRLLHLEVDLCIGPSEHLFYLAVDSMGRARAEAVATILQSDQSCFVVKADSEIQRPRDLEGKTYVGYKTPLEEQVLGAMIEHDGGNPEFEMITPGRLDVWEAFVGDKGDVAWVFSHWEATLAAQEGVGIRKFYPGDHGVPYGYSSVLMARKERTDAMNRRIATFLKVMSRSVGEMLTKADRTVVRQLCAHVDHQNFADETFIAAAWSDIKPAFVAVDSVPWGSMREQKWREWMDWIEQHDQVLGRIDTLPSADEFYDNSLLP